MAAVLLVSFVTWLLPAVPALGTPPDTDVRELDLAFAPAPEGLRALAVDGWREAVPVPAGDAVLVGLDWAGTTELEVEVRASRDGRWSDWIASSAMTDEAPDVGTSEADRVDTTTSEPIWIGPSDEVQVRVRGDAPDVSIQLVDVVGGDGLGYVAPEDRRRGSAAEAATLQPGIRSRASWGADESKVKSRPHVMRDVRFAVVHHTAGSNSYTAEQADDVIRAVYAYHLNNGWDDIAYNFLIDRFGRIWEGRAGGIRNAVRGGHAAGWNEASVGVSVLGNFQGVEPPKVAVDAIDQLVAWKLDIHHVDPKGTTTEVAGGGSSNRYASGTKVELPTIIGHRRTNNTACPGSNLYAHVTGDSVRPAMASRVDAVGHPKAYGGLPAEREQPVLGVRPTWDVEFSRPVDWTLRITRGAGEVVRATSGVAATSTEVTWDLKDAAGRLVAPGVYRAELTGRGADGAVTPVVTTFEITAPVERQGGATRLETAVELSRWAFEDATRVVIASAEAAPDALVASPLAGSLGAPVLLVPAAGVPEVVSTEIKRLRARTAFIVGGPVRIPTAIEAQLKAAGIRTIVRLAGETRYHTAEAVARIVIERENPKEALLALGEHADLERSFTSALTAGAFGANRGLPLVLAQPGQLPGPTAKLLSDLKPARLSIVDSTGGIADSVRQQAATAAGAREVKNFIGADHYETSRLLAEELLARWRAEVSKTGGDPHATPTGFEVVASSGENWPDALGAAAAAAERDVPFVLVAKDSLRASGGTERFFRDHAATLARVVVSGGNVAVSDRTTAEIEGVARSDGPHREPSPVWAPAR
ncbi:MAG: cell wall-binding repeat-containing protein [Actinobacteria bacterium]|nr:cell wall-binding repeat-containing protein [Actinomycetota bacterium]